MSNGKVMIIYLIAGLIKMMIWETSGGDINVEAELSNYATKSDLKNAAGIDTFKLALKPNLANLKAEVDKTDVYKIKTVPIDLSKLSRVVNKDVVKQTVYDKLVATVNNVDIVGFVLKTNYDTDKSELENKISDTSELVKKFHYNAKISEIESKIPSISALATNAALTTVETKIPNVRSLVKKTKQKKTDYDTNIIKIKKRLTDHNHKYITTLEFNKFTAESFAARLAQANLITKTYVDNKLTNLNGKTQIKKLT